MENMSEESIFAYDRVLYPNYLHTQTHPDRLATMSKFFGVNPKPIEKCRVLELGCGTGSSLLSFAYDLPGSEFIGIDLSEKQIELGNLAVRSIGLQNLTLLQGDIMQITREKFGEFDYIIAHGLYSWVPDPVRNQILKISRDLLAEQGVAFVSYNTLPGCHFRQIAREMMLFHTRNLSSPIEKVEQSLGIFKFIAEAAPREKAYQKVFEDEFNRLSKINYENIFHDDLADFNHPVYFHEFVSHAENNDLQYVTEVEHFTAQIAKFSKEVLETLEGISDNLIALEQYLDFINCRRFRQTLLCHKELKISQKPNPQVLRQIRVASPVSAFSEKPELATDKIEKFVAEKTEHIEINHPLTKAALFYLGKIWARTASFEELVEASRQLLAEESGTGREFTKEDEQTLVDILFLVSSSGLLRLHVHEPSFVSEVSEKPQASPIARWQAEHSDSISTLLCTSVFIQDKLGLELVKLLDGTRSQGQLVRDLTEFINSEEFDQPTEIKETILRELPEQLERNLNSFASMALLIS
jgi:methyltransferase-like protein/SAM-dependent methyltransferase